MRRIALMSFVVVAMVCLLAGEPVTAAKSINMPVDASATGPSEHSLVGRANHPLVGDWVVTTPAGTVPAVFGADGSVLLELLGTDIRGDGISYAGFAIGTWEPIGPRSATYTVVQAITHANGINLGTATTVGYLTVSADGTRFIDDGAFTTITIRDANNATVAITGADSTLPVMAATREVAAPVAAVPATGALDPGTILGQGGRDCATCAALFAPVSDPAVVGPAEARYIEAKDAALEPLATQPVAPDFSGCNTCR